MSSGFIIVSALVSVFVLAILISGNSPVSATLCQISGVSYNFPKQAMPNQQIHVDTTITGSCVTDETRYYLLRADLTDKTSELIISSNSTPIGYNARNFTVTVTNLATTPLGANVTWPLEIHAYVINSGGGGGKYLLDYSTVGNIEIQINPTAIPEFPRQAFTVLVLIGTLSLTLLATERQRPLKRRYSQE